MNNRKGGYCHDDCAAMGCGQLGPCRKQRSIVLPLALTLGFIACAGLLYPLLAEQKKRATVRIVNNGCYVFSNGEPLCDLAVFPTK